MARVVDTRIDASIRARVSRGFAELQGNLGREANDVAAYLGVQRGTLEGWTNGRGSPLPKATEGRLLLNGGIANEWADRGIVGLALSNGIRQTGITGIEREYKDTIGDCTLIEAIQRINDYLTRNTGDAWIDSVWRFIRIEVFGGGVYQIWVTYASGISNQDTAQ